MLDDRVHFVVRVLEQFLDAYKKAEAGNGVGQLEFGLVLLCASFFYTMASRMQRS